MHKNSRPVYLSIYLSIGDTNFTPAPQKKEQQIKPLSE